MQQHTHILTVPVLSTYLRIKEKTIYAKVEAGEIPHYRIGRLIRFRLDEIDAWLETCKNQKGQATEKSTPRKRTASSRKPNDHISSIIAKAIDQEREKYYDPGYGKSDRIEDLGKEAQNGTI
jgi:excisionase family DNA binding protein